MLPPALAEATRATKELLDSTFAVRRVGLAKVVNISEPVELFELHSTAGVVVPPASSTRRKSW